MTIQGSCGVFLQKITAKFARRHTIYLSFQLLVKINRLHLHGTSKINARSLARLR